MATVLELGQAVKAKHPEYADIPDLELGRKIKAKYPKEYGDFADMPTPHNDTAGKPAGGDQSGMPDSGIMGALFTPARGVQQIAQGAARTQNPAEGETRGGIADMLHGILNVLSPYLPSAVLAAPAATLTGLAGAGVGAGVGDAAAQAFDASPGARELADTVGGIVGGGVGGSLVPKAVGAAAAKISDIHNSPGGGNLLTGAAQAIATPVAAAMGHPFVAGALGRGALSNLTKAVEQRSSAASAAKPTRPPGIQDPAAVQPMLPRDHGIELTPEQEANLASRVAVTPKPTAAAAEGTPLRTVGVLARERAAVPPMPELPGLPGSEAPAPAADIYSWARQRMAEEKAAQTGSLQMPAGVDPKVWAAMPPQMQQALVQKVNGQAAPSPATVAAGLPPRDASHYGVEATQAAKSPAPEVRAAPTAPPPTGPQTAPGAHPVYSLPQTPLDSDFASGVAFHPESQTGLLTLKNGRTAHIPMSADLYRRILAESADPNGSVGRLWNQEIKPGLQTKANTYVQREPAATLPETAAPSFEQRLAAGPDAMKVRAEVVRRAASQHLSPAQLEALTHQVVAEINTGRAAGGNAAGLIPDWVAQDVARGFK